MRWFLKLLYPGLGIKRWLFLLFLSFLLILGASLGLVLGVPRLSGPVRSILNQFLALTGGGRINLFITLFLGIVLMMVAGIGFFRSLIRGVAPRNATLVDMLYQSRYLRRGPRVVVIGGGTGLSTLLRGLKHFTSNITAVVTVADDGGSSGILRGELGMPPPGDIRNCLVALADTESLLEQLFQYRFKHGDGLGGHSFGNLFLAAMTQMLGFQIAVKESGKVLAIRGKVLPVTASNVQLKAACVDGKVILGESNIGRADSAIQRLELVPRDVQALDEVLEDIAAADAIVVGPGSLYTSLLPNLLVGGVAEAIRSSSALKFYVCNIMTQAGETSSYSAADHLEAIYRHIGPDVFDYIVVNNQSIPPDTLERYAQEDAEPVQVDWERLRQQRVRILAANLLQPGPVARHNPSALARCLLSRIAAESYKPARLLDLLLLEAQLKRAPNEQERDTIVSG
jgi:uncharacterized cofD-like protein